MSLPVVKITTSSGHSWVTNVSSQIDEAEAIRYFMGQRVDISADPDAEKIDRVVKVEYSRP